MAPTDRNEKEIRSRRRARSIALGVVLAILVIAMYALTLDKGGALFQRPA